VDQAFNSIKFAKNEEANKLDYQIERLRNAAVKE
jgi:hypothetical protein